MTEPHAGTDVANYRTNARIVGDRVILKGTKTLISRAPEAGMFVVFTRVDGKPGREGIGCVLLEPNTQGFEVTGTYPHHGRRKPARDPVQRLRTARWKIWSSRRTDFGGCSVRSTPSAASIPSISLGLAEGAFDEAVNYVRERTVFGKPIADFQGIRWKLAECSRTSRPAAACCIAPA